MKLLGGIFLTLILFFLYQNENEIIERMNQPSVRGEIQEVIPYIINFNDTIPSDTLFSYLGENGIPIKYSRNILTGVCIDSECRYVNLILFWNATGRYLGFEIPNGEFLSKTKHVHFSSKEYDRLHNLLSDPNSALANYSISELAPKSDTSNQKVDAVSSATITAVLDYIVKGAVYTTYTLWYITYGPTKREIEKLTSSKLNSEIALKILESKNLSDKVWVLNHISGKMEISTELQKLLMEMIEGSDIYLAERSLNALKPEALTNEIQMDLAHVFHFSGFLQKRLILQKFKEVSNLNTEVVYKFVSDINNSNGTLIKIILELFKAHKIEDELVSAKVCELLKNENRYISAQAFNYLNELDIKNKKTLKNIEKYKKKN